MPKVGAVLCTKEENYKEILQNVQECVLQYMIEIYKKGVYLAPLTRKLEDVDLSSKEPKVLIGTINRAPTETDTKIYESEMKNAWIG